MDDGPRDVIALCENCATTFSAPADTPADRLVTCPACDHVADCARFVGHWTETHARLTALERGQGDWF